MIRPNRGHSIWNIIGTVSSSCLIYAYTYVFIYNMSRLCIQRISLPLLKYFDAFDCWCSFCLLSRIMCVCVLERLEAVLMQTERIFTSACMFIIKRKYLQGNVYAFRFWIKKNVYCNYMVC